MLARAVLKKSTVIITGCAFASIMRIVHFFLNVENGLCLSPCCASCFIYLTCTKYIFAATKTRFELAKQYMFLPGYVTRFDDVFEEKMVRFYLAEMVLAIHTLHTMGYVHR